MPEHDVLGLSGVDFLDREHFVDDAEQCVEGWLDGTPPIDCDVTVKDFLKNFHVGDKPLAANDGGLESPLGVGLVRMRLADEVHRHVRVDENQEERSCP